MIPLVMSLYAKKPKTVFFILVVLVLMFLLIDGWIFYSILAYQSTPDDQTNTTVVQEKTTNTEEQSKNDQTDVVVAQDDVKGDTSENNANTNTDNGVDDNRTPTKNSDPDTDTKDVPIVVGPQEFQKNQYHLKILDLAYYPIDASNRLDAAEVGGETGGQRLEDVRNNVSGLRQELLADLEKGTIYVKDPNQKPFITRSVTEQKEFLIPIPSVDGQGNDSMSIMTDQNICDWVDNKDVREVWVWMYHSDRTYPVESNMSVGTLSKEFWWPGSTFFDISNSAIINDLPVCQHSYTVYNFNYGRDIGTMLENYGHQMEVMLSWVDQNNIFRNAFTRPVVGQPSGSTAANTIMACGDVHFAPNTRFEYDWSSPNEVASNCSDWHPDGSGQTEKTTCEAWGCTNNGGDTFKIWWMQRFPGYGNNVYFENTTMRNWWEFFADFDAAVDIGRSLVKQS